MEDLSAVKNVPGYEIILKSILKNQIKILVEQLYEETGEEVLLLTASLKDGTFSNLGSPSGKSFFVNNPNYKAEFYGHCITEQKKLPEGKRKFEGRPSPLIKKVKVTPAPPTSTPSTEKKTPHIVILPSSKHVQSTPSPSPIIIKTATPSSSSQSQQQVVEEPVPHVITMAPSTEAGETYYFMDDAAGAEYYVESNEVASEEDEDEGESFEDSQQSDKVPRPAAGKATGAGRKEFSVTELVEKKQIFSCEKCGRICVSQKEYLRHYKANHRAEHVLTQRLCNVCGGSFSTSSTLKRHRERTGHW